MSAPELSFHESPRERLVTPSVLLVLLGSFVRIVLLLVAVEYFGSPWGWGVVVFGAAGRTFDIVYSRFRGRLMGEEAVLAWLEEQRATSRPAAGGAR